MAMKAGECNEMLSLRTTTGQSLPGSNLGRKIRLLAIGLGAKFGFDIALETKLF